MFENVKWKMENKRVSKERIENFLSKTTLKIPEDYLQFLIERNGMYPEDYHSFYIPDVKHGAILKALYGFDLSIKSDCLDTNYYYNFNYDIPPEYIIIGECYGEGGLVIMLSTEEETAGIYACDLFYDDFVFEESTEDNNAYKLADTFTEFIENLKYVDASIKQEAYFPKYDFTFTLPE